MNKLSIEKRSQILAALVEGNSIRSTCRMTETAKGTVLKLLADAGQVCAKYQDEKLINLSCRHIQCDEIWSFCYSKQKNIPENMEGTFGVGDVWTWVALDADTKLAATWLVGLRTAECATWFIEDLAQRVSKRIQLTTDGYKIYVNAVEGAFGCDIDYAMLVKLYGDNKEGREGQARYSPARCVGTEHQVIQGNPDDSQISTSHVERQNLTMRMSMRRFTRLTNAFSKKVENLEAAVALHFMYYNFCRVHSTLKTTPAIAAGVEKRVWTLRDIVKLLENSK